MTVILITFLHGKPYSNLAQRCSVLSEAQLSARKGLSLADILDSSDDEDPPSPPPRPPHMMSGSDQEGSKPPVKVESGSESLASTEGEKEKGMMMNGSEGQVESADPTPSTDGKGQTSASMPPYDIN